MAACVIVVVSCLAWVGGISWTLAYFLELTPMVGWMLAAALGFSTTLAATIILYELRHAIDLTDCVEATEFEGLMGVPWEMPRVLPHGQVSALGIRGGVC